MCHCREGPISGALWLTSGSHMSARCTANVPCLHGTMYLYLPPLRRRARSVWSLAPGKLGTSHSVPAMPPAPLSCFAPLHCAQHPHCPRPSRHEQFSRHPRRPRSFFSVVREGLEHQRQRAGWSDPFRPGSADPSASVPALADSSSNPPPARTSTLPYQLIQPFTPLHSTFVRCRPSPVLLSSSTPLAISRPAL